MKFLSTSVAVLLIGAALQIPTAANAVPTYCATSTTGTVNTRVQSVGLNYEGHVIVGSTVSLVLKDANGATTSCAPYGVSYKWFVSTNVNLSDETEITGQTSSTLVTNNSMVNKFIRMSLSYKKYNYSATPALVGPVGSSTILTSTTLNVWPEGVVVPSLDDTTPVLFSNVGDVLTAEANGLTGTAPITESWRWWSCNSNSELIVLPLAPATTYSIGAITCNIISGATSNTYTVTPSNPPLYFFPEVTETSDLNYGSVRAIGYSIPEVTQPTFTGTSWEGQTLTGTASATGYPAPAITYSWQTTSNGTDWTEVGTASTYKIKASDRSYTAQMQIRLVATATTGSLSDSKSSDESNTYTYPNANGGSVTAPSPAAPGTYTPGKYDVGQTVIGHPWQIMGTPWPTLHYQWYVCNSPSGTSAPTAPASGCSTATGSGNNGTSTRAGTPATNDLGNFDFSYVVTSGEAGKFLTFTATLTNAATEAISTPYAFSQSRIQHSGAINTAPAITGTPDITGIISVGKKLTAATVTYSGTPTGKITYQWMTSDTEDGTYTPISTAKSTTYNPLIGDLNKYIRVVATATSPSGSTATAASTNAYLVNPAYSIPSGISATVTGTTKSGEVLTATASVGAGYPTSYSYVYKWYACNSSGNACLVLNTQTSASTTSTYTLTSSEIGKFIRVGVTVSTGAGAAAEVKSSISNQVAAYYALGDTGPGGGTIYYYSPAAFTEAGATCNTSCHYLEYAPASAEIPGAWAGSNWRVKPTFAGLGKGLSNTTAMRTRNIDPYQYLPSAAAISAYNYAATDGSAHQWFIGSNDEMSELVTYFQTRNYEAAGFKSTYYFTSTEGTLVDAGQYVQVGGVSLNLGTFNWILKNSASWFRPIRAI